MSGDNNKYTPEEMYSKEELESRLAFMKDTAPIREQIKKISDGQKSDYTVKRKVIYKGKIAPPGHVFIVLYLKKSKRKFEAHILIRGHMGEVYEMAVQQKLRELIRAKYEV